MDTCQSGDRWSLQLGDALALMPDLPTGSVDALVTDPPYSSGGMFRGDRMGSTNAKYVGTNVEIRDARANFGGDNRDQRAFLTWCHLWLSEAQRVVKPGGLCVLFTDWRQLPTVTDALQVGGWIWRGLAVWDKTSAVRPQLGRYRQQAEFIVWGSNGAMVHEGPVVDGVFRHRRGDVDRQHATGKPVPLMADILRIVPPGGVVLDPFTGGGATGVAALQRPDLVFIGYELVPSIFDLAGKRLQRAAAGLPDELVVNS